MTVWLISVIFVLGCISAVCGALAAVIVTRHHASDAADLAALAGAGRTPPSCRVAAATARANGAELVSCRAIGSGVWVAVRIPLSGPLRHFGAATAQARAIATGTAGDRGAEPRG